MPLLLNSNDSIATRLSLAIFGEAAGGNIYRNYVSEIASKGASAVAASMAGSLPTMTDAQLSTATLKNLGVTAATIPAASYAALESAVATLFTANGAAARGQIILNLTTLLSGLTKDATYGAAATAWNTLVDSAYNYSASVTATGAVANVSPAKIATLSGLNLDATIALTTGADNVTGTAGDNVFDAYVIDNSNTLQSGDRIDGGAGIDALVAVLGNASAFAITPRTVNVEQVYVRSQANNTNGNTGSNNVSNAGQTQNNNNVNTIDAQDMVGVKEWHNESSRSDLVIEDVRIQPSEITKDITIRWADTDPASTGDKVDYALYFSPESLRTTSSTAGSVFNFELMDTRAATASATAATPLLNSPFDGVRFTLGGVTKTLRSPAIDNATTYADLLKAVQDALAAAKATDTSLAGVTAAFGPDFVAVDTISGVRATGRTITLTNTGSAAFGTGSFLTPDGGVPASSGLHTVQSNALPATSTDLITSKIILDNVGRESEAGMLTIGSMSTRTGVERFEVTVTNNDDTVSPSGRYTASGSWISTLQSTNNTLREVIAVNAGALTTGQVADYLSIGTGMDANGNNLTTQRDFPGFLNTDGLKDVRLFDASAMTGVVRVGASVTSDSIRKYNAQGATTGITLGDTASSATADNVAFVYTTGSAADAINLAIDGATASSTNTVTGRADFTFSVNGGAGDDRIQVSLNTGGGNAAAWYNNQDILNNVTINGGDGNDTINKPGAGDTNIVGGAGNDTVYAENTGRQTLAAAVVYNNINTNAVTTTYVFNTADQVNQGVTAARNISDLRGDTTQSYNLFKADLTVTFRGLTSKVTIGEYTTNDLEINQYIKRAINNDAVLSKLLVAEDGAGGTLVVRALIDKDHLRTDLSVSLAAPAAAAITASDIGSATAAYGAAATRTAADVVAAVNTSITSFNTRGDYVTQFANDNAAQLVGARSTQTSDNTITGGDGNDVIVLGSALGAGFQDSSNDTIVFSGNFGSDVLVNFNTSGAGIDFMDFSAYGVGTGVTGGTTSTTLARADKALYVLTEAAGAAGNDTLAKVQALVTANDTAGVTTATTYGIIVANTTTGVAKVYTVADAAGASNALVSERGSITMATASNPWAELVANGGALLSQVFNPPAPTTPVGSTGTIVTTGANVPALTLNATAAGYTVRPATADFAGTGTVADVAAFDKVGQFTIGKTLSIPGYTGAATVVTGGATYAAPGNGQAVLYKGTFNSATQQFTISDAGTSTLVVYDSNTTTAVTADAVVLVGYVQNATTGATGVTGGFGG